MNPETIVIVFTKRAKPQSDHFSQDRSGLALCNYVVPNVEAATFVVPIEEGATFVVPIEAVAVFSPITVEVNPRTRAAHPSIINVFLILSSMFLTNSVYIYQKRH
jgi:hypothetical protein